MPCLNCEVEFEEKLFQFSLTKKIFFCKAEFDIVLDVDIVRFNNRQIATEPTQREKKG